MIKIDVVSGFLGAGKTTLIKKLLAGPLAGQQIVLIENEFGEIGIDGGFLKEAGIEIREMNSGCICCSLVGDFGTALKEVAETYHPDRVIIEPSGVGKLSDVIGAVKDVAEAAGMEVNSATAVVDVTKCKIYLKNFGEFYKDQIDAAGTIILTRTDLAKATKEKVDEAVGLIRGINEKATVITTPVAELDGEKLLSVMEEGSEDLAAQVAEEMKKSHEHHHHHHEDGEECHCHDEEQEHHHHHHEDGEECHCHDEEHEHHHEDGEECHCHDEEHEHHHHHHDHDHHHHHHHHHGDDHDADEVFTSWGVETAHKFSREDLEKILAELDKEDVYGIVLRAKGMVQTPEGGWLYFDMVPEETDIREGAPEITGKLCVIGAELKEDKVKELFGV